MLTYASAKAARIYVAVVGAFSAIVAGAGWLSFGSRDGIHMVMGMALDRRVNVAHTLWAGAGALFGLAPDLSTEDLPKMEDVRHRVGEMRDAVPEVLEELAAGRFDFR
jgi:hypothetical protein